MHYNTFDPDFQEQGQYMSYSQTFSLQARHLINTARSILTLLTFSFQPQPAAQTKLSGCLRTKPWAQHQPSPSPQQRG